MQSMESSHKEVQSEEEHIAFAETKQKCTSRINIVVNLSSPFEIFVYQENQCKYNGCCQQYESELFIPKLQSCDLHGNCHTTD